MAAKKYKLTPEHRAQLKPWADKWIANAMSTAPMTDDDRDRARAAVLGLYAAAKLPPPKAIVFVPSPFVLHFAGGFAAALWWLHDQRGGDAATRDATYAATVDATRDATDDATYAATRDATYAATRDATYAATVDATDAATSDATRDATVAATRDATYVATRDATVAATSDATDYTTYAATRDATVAATYAATYVATRDATVAATRSATRDATDDATYAATVDATNDAGSGLWYRLDVGSLARLAAKVGGPHADILLRCAANSFGMRDGGNQWSGWASYLSFFRHVAKLELDYSGWDHYETLALVSGPRIMHKDFAMVCDRPELLTVDAQNRPHNDTGPFCRWRDGAALYSIHGVRVPAYVVERPESITVEGIHAEPNAEVRRVMIDRYGLGRYVRDAQFEVLDADTDPLGQPRRLLRKDRLTVVELTNSTVDADGTRRVYHVPVHPELRPLLPDGGIGEPQQMTALNAVASTYGLRGEEYVLEVET